MLICSLILSCLLEVCGELRSVSGAGLGSGVLNRRIAQHTCPRSPGSLEEAEILGDGPEVLLSECEVVELHRGVYETQKRF